MMNDELLKEKMNELGQLMFEKEQAEIEFLEEHKAQFDKVEALREEIKAEILKRQVSMDSEKLIVTWRKGAVRWDTLKLKEKVKEYPWLKDYQKMGDPTVSFKLREAVDFSDN